jgi:hypothetical protein
MSSAKAKKSMKNGSYKESGQPWTTQKKVSAITNIQPGDMERNKTDTTPSASKLQARITVMVSAGGRTGYRRKSKKLIPVLGHFP